MSVLHSLAAPAATYASVAGYEVGTGRLVPSAAAIIGLFSVIIGWRSATRAARTGNAANAAILAMAVGLISAVIGGVHAANAAGGLGTGNGLAGAVVALALGVIGVIIGGLALARSRRYS